MRTVDGVRVALLSYVRESDIAYLTHDSNAESIRLTTQSNLLSHLEYARISSRTTQQWALIDEASRRTRRYLDVRHAEERRGEPLEHILTTATPPLQAALDSLKQLERLDFQIVEDTQAMARRWEQVADVAGIIITVFLIGGFASILVGVRRLVFAPLFSLSDGINRYTAGDRELRIPPTGPEEFRQTVAAFNGMLNELARQEASKRTFIASVAHDLRNPLTALRLRIQCLDRARPASEDQLRAAIAIVKRQVERLERMLGDFLDASEIERGELSLNVEPCDLRDLVRDIAELHRPTPHGEVSLSLPDAPVIVRCDPVRIDQVLENLLSNAIKYSPRGGDIAVSVAQTRDGAIVEVSDRGVGIPEEELAYVFDPYRRSGPSKKVAAGTGLGLFVARQIAVAHGGGIEVESKLGAGSTFRLRLPLGGRPIPH
jgi:signal transduction histidine kinase